ncbi:MAG TPA: pentapeptide repeat-containing protein [Gemmatimonadales bacterium]|nr:pentapeptide repeat-containing protein [Gemmatimonadales bacterium]
MTTAWRRIFWTGIALAAASAAPGHTRVAAAQERLDRDRVLALLAGATPEHPADLSGKDLSGLDLSGVDLKRANLSKCLLVGTNFRNAKLFAVTLSDADATGADFTATTLDLAVAYRVRLARAVLRDASAFATILEGADLSDADLSGARFLGPMSHATAPRAKFVKANLGVDPANQSMGQMRVDATAVDFSGADFTGASLRKALLARANFAGADLTDADVTYADLAGARLANVRGRERIRGLDRAVHVDEALFHD